MQQPCAGTFPFDALVMHQRSAGCGPAGRGKAWWLSAPLAQVGAPTTKSVTVDKQTGIKPGSVGLTFGPNPGVGLRVNGVTDGASAALTATITPNAHPRDAMWGCLRYS